MKIDILDEYWYGLGVIKGKHAILGPYNDMKEADKFCLKHFGIGDNHHRNFILFCEYYRDIKTVTEKVLPIIKGK